MYFDPQVAGAPTGLPESGAVWVPFALVGAVAGAAMGRS
jgi:hypothetical protein